MRSILTHRFGSILLSTTLLVLGSTATAEDYDRYRDMFEPLPEMPPIPEDNPQTEEKVQLGKKLFFEPRLSRDRNISCASCHNPATGWGDRNPVSVGHQGKTGDRNSPTVLNSGFLEIQFWDGRAADLEEQALMPIEDPVEMALELDEAIERLRSFDKYQDMFAAAWSDQDEPVNEENLGKALAAFQRTLNTPDSPFDRFLEGDDDALTEQQKRGMAAFADNGCTACHTGPALTDSNFHRFELEGAEDDKGRYEETGDEADKYAFRTQTLRNIERTGPYFHTGEVDDLGEAIRVMGEKMANRELDDDTVEDIEAFLVSLTGEKPDIRIPRLP